MVGIRLFVVCLIGVCLASAGAAGSRAADIDSAKGDRLVGQRLLDAMSGATLEYSHAWSNVVVQFRRDGTVAGGHQTADVGITGKWWVEDDQICVDLISTLAVSSGCYLFVLDGGTLNWYDLNGDWAETSSYVKPDAPASALATGPTGGGRLTGAELSSVFSDARIELRQRGQSRSIQYNADGSLLQTFQSVRDTGEWWVDGDRLCSRWADGNLMRPSRARCYSVAKEGEIVKFFRPDGSIDRQGRYVQ